jgi:hypothetical protein
MTALAIIALIVGGAVVDAAVQRRAVHGGVEPWPTD